MMEEDEMMGEEDPCEFLYSMCNVVKMKAESYVMLLLRHAAGFIFLLMMHFAYEEREEGVELEEMPELWINLPPLISLVLSVFDHR